MQNVILVVHLILALSLIAAVLLQRSEGGALGMGGGGGGMVSARGAASALTKLTWWLAGAFLATSISLTVISGGGRDSGSLLDGVGGAGDGIVLPDLPAAAEDSGVVLPSGGGTTQAPATPAPATPPTAE